MKVFIENEKGSNKKNLFNEKTLEYKETQEVSATYPYPYGFLLNTTSGDGDNLDCFIVTSKRLKTGDIIDVKAIGMFEQIEDGEIDHKILAALRGEEVVIDERIENKLRNFGKKVFSHIPHKQLFIGRFLGLKEARALIQASQDKKK